MFCALGNICCNTEFNERSASCCTSFLIIADTVTAIALLTLGALIMKGTLFPNNTAAASCLLAFGGLQSMPLIVKLLIACKGMKETCCPSKTQKNQ